MRGVGYHFSFNDINTPKVGTDRWAVRPWVGTVRRAVRPNRGAVGPAVPPYLGNEAVQWVIIFFKEK
jgi:hypothetical protein